MINKTELILYLLSLSTTIMKIPENIIVYSKYITGTIDPGSFPSPIDR